MSTDRDNLAEDYETKKWKTSSAVYSAEAITSAFKAGWDCNTEWFHVTEAEYRKLKKMGVKKATPKKRKKK